MLNSHQPARPGLLKLLAVVVVTAMVALVAGSTSAGATGGGSPVAAASDQGVMRAPIVQRTDEGWFRGHFTPTAFEVVGDQVVAHGTVSGLVHKKGEGTKKVSEAVSMPVMLSGDSGVAGRAVARGGLAVAAAAATCDVLNLVLGPLDLNLLGLEIHLDTVVLDIVANPAGGLLGDLLCSVANLLDGGPLDGLLAQLTDLLQQILGVLNTGGL